MSIAIKECRHGTFMFNPRDLFVGRSLDLYGEFSEEEVRLFAKLLRPGAVALDIGANIGALTVPIARLVGPLGRVFAFEPQRHLFHMLCGNLALNDLHNVSALNIGIGSERSRMGLPPLDYAAAANFGGVELKLGQDVDVFALDELGLAKCDFMKIDVEGMEERVIRGAVRTIGSHHPILYVENDRREKSADLIRLLWSHGYKLYWHTPLLYSAANYRKHKGDVFPGTVSINLLCAHPQRDVGVTDPPIDDPTSWPLRA